MPGWDQRHIGLPMRSSSGSENKIPAWQEDQTATYHRKMGPNFLLEARNLSGAPSLLCQSSSIYTFMKEHRQNTRGPIVYTLPGNKLSQTAWLFRKSVIVSTSSQNTIMMLSYLVGLRYQAKTTTKPQNHLSERMRKRNHTKIAKSLTHEMNPQTD